MAGNKLAREFGFVPSQGNPITPETIMKQFRRLTVNPLTSVLQFRDSPVLQPEQIVQLKREEIQFQASADSLYRPLVDLIVAKKGRISDSDLVARLSQIRITLSNLMSTSMRSVGAIIVEQQRERLPAYLQQYLQPNSKK